MNKNAFWMLIIIVLGGGIFFLLEKNDVYMDETATLVDANAPVTIEANKELQKEGTNYEGIPLNEETRKLTFTEIIKDLPLCDAQLVPLTQMINIDDVVTNCITKEKTGVQTVGLGGGNYDYFIHNGEVVIYLDGQDQYNDKIMDASSRFVCSEVNDAGEKVGAGITVKGVANNIYGGKVTVDMTAMMKVVSLGYIDHFHIPRYPLQATFCDENDTDCSRFIEGPRSDGTNYIVPGYRGDDWEKYFYVINGKTYAPNADDTIHENYLTTKDRKSKWIPISVQNDKIVFSRIKNYNASPAGLATTGDKVQSTFTLETCDVLIQ